MSKDGEFYNSESFEEKLNTLIPNITEAEYVKGGEQVAFMCKCSSCPSFQGSDEKRTAFCTLGKSIQIFEKKGCLCRVCPNTKMMNLRWDYYCIQSNALDLSQKEKTDNIVIPLSSNNN